MSETVKVSLAKALKMRSQLRTININLAEALSDASVYYECKCVAESNPSTLLPLSSSPFEFKGMTFDETFKKLDRSSQYLVTVNSGIDQANACRPRQILNQISEINSTTQLVDIISTRVNAVKEKVKNGDTSFNEKIYNVNTKAFGDNAISTFNYNTSIDWDAVLLKMKKLKIQLEYELTEVNSKLEVELPKDITQFIDDNVVLC